MFRRFLPGRFSLVIAVTILLGATLVVHAAEDEGEKKDPPTKRSHTVRADIFKELERAQEAADKKDAAGAFAILQKLQEKGLTEYEQATVWSVMARVYYETDNYASAIESFRKVLGLADIPEGMRITTLFSLAQLQLASEQYQACIDTLKQLYSVVESPSADAYALEAHARFQMKDYRGTVDTLLKVMKLAKEQNLQYKENWLALLRAGYYELEDHPNAAKVLEVLVSLYPKKEYWVQLAGLYGLMGRESDQLAAMEAAWEQKFLDRQAELVSLAQLMLLQGVPYKAWKVLEKGFKDEIIKETFETLRLLAQAMAMAQEHEKQIPVLAKAAKLAKDGEIDLYLGQAFVALEQWAKAVDALEASVRKGVKRPGPAYLLLGTARFNLNRFEPARAAFRQAKKDERSAKSADQWLRYVDAEERRRELLAAADGQ